MNTSELSENIIDNEHAFSDGSKDEKKQTHYQMENNLKARWYEQMRAWLHTKGESCFLKRRKGLHTYACKLWKWRFHPNDVKKIKEEYKKMHTTVKFCLIDLTNKLRTAYVPGSR